MTLRKAVKPVIIGISNIRLTDDERKLLKDHSPLGIILFARNLRRMIKVSKIKKFLLSLLLI